MIRIKTKAEIDLLRKGGKILANILDATVKQTKAGVSTKQLEEYACRKIKEAGGRPAFKNYMMPGEEAFPTALCISINNEIVHAPALPAREIKFGDIVGVDVGMEYPAPNNTELKNKHSEQGGYYTDMSRTVVVGSVSDRVQELVDVTKKSLELAINQVKPGNCLDDIGTAIQVYAESYGFSVVRDLVGHGVGHEVHESPQVPNFSIKNDKSLENVVLKPGMVIAIEPMVNMGGAKVQVGEDGFAIETADNSLSAHFEHTIAVTDKGHLVITDL